MKKAVVMLLLGVSAYAQESVPVEVVLESPQIIEFTNKLLVIKDLQFADGRMLVTEVPCQIGSGAGSCNFLVSVVCQQKAFREIGLEKINEIIMLANKKAQSTIQLEHSYAPAEIKLSYNPIIKDWSLTNLFSTTDKHGKVNNKLLSMDFDATGAFKVMKSVF